MGPNSRWHKEAGWLRAAVGCSELGRPSRPKKEEGAGRPAGALLDWARRKGNRPSGPEARQREGEGFIFFFKLLNPFSNRFEFLLNFWIKANHHNKKYAPA